jgi:hypothetical protein
MLLQDSLIYGVYFDGVFANEYNPLPGVRLLSVLDSEPKSDSRDRLEAKVMQSARKLALMWRAGEEAKEAEREFYLETIAEAPVLYGRHAISVHYHLEAFVLFARSALDIGAAAFSERLPPPFVRKRCDSFNDLLKTITKTSGFGLSAKVLSWRTEEDGWLKMVADIEKGRSLRDKLVHQIGFPISYTELNPHSDKRSPVVLLGDGNWLPLPAFIERLRTGVVQAFLALESTCL